MSRVPRFSVLAAVVVAAGFCENGVCRRRVVAGGPLPREKPEAVGMDAGRLAVIDEIVAEGIERKRMPGAVVLVARKGRIVHFKAYADRQVEPQRRPMSTDTVFDLASLTKPVATATSIMKLTEAGRLHPRDRVAKHVPEFKANGKEEITIYQLLTHQGGLVADNPLADYADGPERAMQRIYALKPVAEPGSRFIYSDVGFIVLGEVVERVGGMSVHEFSQKHVFGPLGMTATGFLPGEKLRRRAAPTEKRDPPAAGWMQGRVHDPRAHRLGGIAGHAGLFSTAEDLAVYAQMLLGGGEYGGVRVLQPATVAMMTRAYRTPRGLRGLGWDKRSPYSSNRGDLFSDRAFGHGGFTGTAMWIDPELELIVIFLSNRLHPDGKGRVNDLAGRIGTVAAAAVCSDRLQAVPAGSDPRQRAPRGLRRDGPDKSDHYERPDESGQYELLTGIDVLQRDGFRRLEGRRVGLITNHTSVDRRGRSTASILHRARNVELAALFSPEHGIAGRLDVPVIDDARDEKTGLKVFSLYGETRKPTAAMLRGIDTLVFDIQDIGTRFYTYISTMGLAMQAAAEHKLHFVVLDRPNPIGGVEVAGPVLDAGSESFVGFHRLPVRHGMTVGELARLFKAELKLGLELQVIKMEGWRRSGWYDRTGLPWINPSPNMRSLRQAALYPGIGLLETTNVSVGRGTDTPFEVLGAPWIDGVELAGRLNRSRLAGVRFVPVRFTPAASRFQGEPCGGVEIIVTDRSAFRPVRTGLAIAVALRRMYPDKWETKNFNRLLSNRRVFEAVLAGKDVNEIELIYEPELRSFCQRRESFLLYR